jgi:hypothetical protein
MKLLRIRFAVLGLGLGLAAITTMRSSEARVHAQVSNRDEDAVVKLAGRKVRIDKST